MTREEIDYRAAAEELEKIVWGAVSAREVVTSKLAGHWAGRVLGAALPERDES